MNFESLDIISEYCENVFFRSKDSNGLLVFLPSVNGKSIYPYYPRLSWGKELQSDYNVLYLSDPYQPLSQYEEVKGSWFISPDGDSTLKELSRRINQIKEALNIKSVTFYGSSMGGYAAIVLSTLVDGAKAIAECPQLYLRKHPGSRFVCENVLRNNVLIESLEPMSYLMSGKQQHIHIVCSIFDRHYSQHVLPFIEELHKNDGEQVSLTVNLYSSSDYQKGHVSLKREDAVREIRRVMGGF